MRLVTIKPSFLKLYTCDPEMLQKAKRPCALIIQMKYKGHRYDFAVPMRSNINPSAPKDEYFALPPRVNTKSKYHHGIHYIKMFPVKRSFVSYFRTEGNVYASLIKAIIEQNEKLIINECQTYLSNYEDGFRPKFSTDIDLLIEQMKKTEI